MHQFAREEHNLVLLRRDRLIRAVADILIAIEPGVVEPQFPALELPWFLMEEVDERQMTRGHAVTAVVAVEMEEVSVIAGSDLRFHTGDIKFFHPQLGHYFGENGFDALEDDFLVLAEIHQDTRAAVVVVDDAAFRNRRDHFAGLEIGFPFECEASEFGYLLRREELIEDDAASRQCFRTFNYCSSGSGDYLAFYAAAR